MPAVRRIVLAAALASLGPALALAQGPAPALAPPSAAERTAIDTVISRQIDAFRRGDAAAAFSYVTPAIRAEFGSARRFVTIVRSRYRPVYDPSAVAFGDLTGGDGSPVQIVFLTTPNGMRDVARYTMQQEPDGSWLIASCTLTHSVDLFS